MWYMSDICQEMEERIDPNYCIECWEACEDNSTEIKHTVCYDCEQLFNW